GRSWLMDMDAMSGGQLSFIPLDLNNDKKFNDTDLVTIIVNGSPMKVPVAGIQTDNGISTAPGLLSGGTLDYGFTTGSGGDGGGTAGCAPGVRGCGLPQGIQPYPGAYGRQSWRQLRECKEETMRRETGMTLVELVTPMLVLGILTAIAIPSYTSYMRKTRRADAKVALTNSAQQFERCYTRFNAYNPATACVVLPYNTPNNTYTIAADTAPVTVP